MPDLTLAHGGVVRVTPPTVPSALIPGPTTPGVLVVPVVGPTGPRGPAGDASGLSYHHVQTAATEEWTIVHNLGFNPAGIIAHDSIGDIIEPAEITWPDIHTTVMTYPGRPTSGRADLS